MTAFLFIAAIAALALSGLIVLAIPYVRSLDAPACVAIALPAGMTFCGVLMFATSVMNIRWSRTLFIAMLRSPGGFGGDIGSGRGAGGASFARIDLRLRTLGDSGKRSRSIASAAESSRGAGPAAGGAASRFGAAYWMSRSPAMLT